MDVVILGAGRIGSYVGSMLSREGHNVTVIDRDRKLLERVNRENDIATFQANAPNWGFFKELHKGLFFAATGNDELNLVACSLAKSFGFHKTVARVKARDYLDPSRSDFGRLFSIDHFIGAEILAAQDLFKTLLHVSDIAAEHFAHGAIQMRTLLIPEAWKAKQIRDLDLPEELLIGLIRRKMKEGERFLIPHGDDSVLPNDEVTVIGEARLMSRLPELFHSPEQLIRSVVLVGGTLIAEHLAHFLLQQQITVRIIDSDLSRCEQLAEFLPEATIINRDGKDAQLLKSERIGNADALVSCTHSDGRNLLIAALAKELGYAKAIALIADRSYASLLDKVGVLPALSGYTNLANRILSIVHEGTILSIASLGTDQIKIVELRVAPSSKLIGTPLSELNLPKNFLLAVIQSGKDVVIGKGKRMLSPGDIAIAICSPDQIPQLPELFS